MYTREEVAQQLGIGVGLFALYKKQGFIEQPKERREIAKRAYKDFYSQEQIDKARVVLKDEGLLNPDLTGLINKAQIEEKYNLGSGVISHHKRKGSFIKEALKYKIGVYYNEAEFIEWLKKYKIKKDIKKSNSVQSKLREVAIDIIDFYREGYAIEQIANYYNVSQPMVSKVLSGEPRTPRLDLEMEDNRPGHKKLTYKKTENQKRFEMAQGLFNQSLAGRSSKTEERAYN